MNNEFNLDDFKEDFKQNDAKSATKDSNTIKKILSRSSVDNVKYILIISIVEFFIGVLFFIYDITIGNNVAQNNSNYNFSEAFIENLDNFSMGWRIAYFTFLIISASFILTFYRLYKKLKIDDSVKKFNSDLLKFRKTANIFIAYNIFMFIVFWMVVTLFLGNQFQLMATDLGYTNVDKTLVYIYILSVTLLLILLTVIFIYYRYFWGYFLNRLKKNQKELEELNELKD